MLRKLVLFIVVLLSTARLGHAQVIRGKVIVASSQPPDQIEVWLETEGRVVVRWFADSSGAFEFHGISFGGYDIIARAEGYEESRTRVDVSPGPAGDSAPIVNLQLERKPTEVVHDSGALIGDVTELNRNYPKKVLQEFEKGIEQSRKDNPAKAIQHLETVIKEAPEFYDAHNLLGSMYQKLDRFRDAEKEYKRARELNSRSALPMINLGNLYIQEADSTNSSRRPRGRSLNDALDALDEAVKLNAQSAVAYYLLGLAYYKSNSNDEAEPNLKRALELDPHMGATRLVLINLYTREEKWESALDNLNDYLTENSKVANRAQLEAARRKLTENLQRR